MSWPSRSTHTGSRTRRTTCSRWRRGWTRWCSARRRSTRRSVRRCASPRPRARRGPRRDRCSTRRAGPDGAPGPRRRSARRPTRSSRSAPISRPTSWAICEGRDVVVVGAGQMAGLAVKHLRDRGVGAIRVLNRSLERARALAERSGDGFAGLDQLSTAIAGADLVVSATGAIEAVIDARVLRARARREPTRAPRPRWIWPCRATSPRTSRRSMAFGSSTSAPSASG